MCDKNSNAFSSLWSKRGNTQRAGKRREGVGGIRGGSISFSFNKYCKCYWNFRYFFLIFWCVFLFSFFSSSVLLQSVDESVYCSVKRLFVILLRHTRSKNLKLHSIFHRSKEGIQRVGSCKREEKDWKRERERERER